MESRWIGMASVNFEFINVTGGSGRERRRNNYLARAHAAKINRQNYKTHAESRRSKHAQTFSLLPKATTRKASTEEIIERTPSSEDSTDCCKSHGVESGARPSRKAGSVTSESSEQALADSVETLSSPRNISPSYGGLVIDTFDWNAQPVSAKAVQYLLKVSWPTRSGEEVTRAWWTEFCQSPIIFHVSHLASAVHRDLLVGEGSWSSSEEILIHKTKSIRLVNDQLARLSSLDRATVDRLIFAVCTLSRHEIEPKHLQPGDTLLFTAYLPHANGTKQLGRLNLNQSARTLLAQLVDSQGGLDKLEIPGLGEILALYDSPALCVLSKRLMKTRIDIRESSIDMSRPKFPLFWTISESLDFERYAGISHTSPGKGFTNLSGSLPAQALASFCSLAHAEMVMAYHDLMPQEKNVRTVLYVRNAAIHSVLSLPPWDELPELDQERTDLAIYEACRVSAVIYSNGVLLGMPPHSGWHRVFVERLRSILEAIDLSSQANSWPELLVWILFVGAIASYRTPHRCFFETALRDTLLLSGMLSWRVVRQSLGDFVWSEKGCDNGASVIWDAMDLQSTWPC